MDLTLDGSDLVLSSLLVFLYIRMKLVYLKVETGSDPFLLSGYVGTYKKGQVKTIIKIYLQYLYFTCQILASVKLFFNSGDQKYMNIMVTFPNIFFVHLL